MNDKVFIFHQSDFTFEFLRGEFNCAKFIINYFGLDLNLIVNICEMLSKLVVGQKLKFNDISLTIGRWE